MYRLFFKRLLDIILSFTALVVASTVFLVIIIWLWFANKGKPFFKQERPGVDKKCLIYLLSPMHYIKFVVAKGV